MEANFKYELGKEGKDIITGFSGIIVGRVQYLFGCNQYGLAAKAISEKGKGETQYFDEGRIEVIGDGIKPSEVAAERPGADHNGDAP